MAAWMSFERMIADLSRLHLDKLSTLGGRPRPPLMALNEMVQVGVFEPDDAKQINTLRGIRNEVMHGMVDYRTVVSREVIQRLEQITKKYRKVIDSPPTAKGV